MLDWLVSYITVTIILLPNSTCYSAFITKLIRSKQEQEQTQKINKKLKILLA